MSDDVIDDVGLVAKNLHASYGAVEVLRGLDFEVAQGKVLTSDRILRVCACLHAITLRWRCLAVYASRDNTPSFGDGIGRGGDGEGGRGEGCDGTR